MPETPVITRFAPSPTGHLHVGGARTALFCAAFARRSGGVFLLRVEDTDLARSSASSARGILEDLAWLGIAWDEGPELEAGPRGADPGGRCGGDPRNVGPFFQARRRDVYAEHLEGLVERDLAYPAFETPEEIGALRAEAQSRKETFRFRRADTYDRAAALERMRSGDPCVIRFNAAAHAGDLVVPDAVLGDVRIASGELDDFVIRKADGMPTYHFAVVVDDELMGVTHVLRGQEHLINTPRHVALQRALGFGTPVYAHMPLIFNPDGSKMSKRDKDKAAKRACRERGIGSSPIGSLTDEAFAAWLKDKQRQLGSDQLIELADALGLELPEIDIEDFRRSGYLPEVLCNYLALLGWSPGLKDADGRDVERFDLDFLFGRFSLERIGKSNSKFDRDKLASFNAASIAALDDAVFARRWLGWAESYDPALASALGSEAMRLAAGSVKVRCRTLRDARGVVAFALVDDDAYPFEDKAVRKALRKGEPSGATHLAAYEPRLATLDPFTPEHIEADLVSWAESAGVGLGQIAQPIRVAVTGTSVSPPLGVTLALLGRERAVRRLRRCLSECVA